MYLARSTVTVDCQQVLVYIQTYPEMASQIFDCGQLYGRQVNSLHTQFVERFAGIRKSDQAIVKVAHFYLEVVTVGPGKGRLDEYPAFAVLSRMEILSLPSNILAYEALGAFVVSHNGIASYLPPRNTLHSAKKARKSSLTLAETKPGG